MSEILNSLINLLSDLSLLQWCLVPFGAFLLYFWRYVKSQWRFGSNLKRKVYFLKTSEDKKLQTQRDRIKGLGLFNLESDIKDIKDSLDILQNLKDNAVYIVGYDKKYNYDKLFKKAELKNIPVLIFANQGEIKKNEDWELFNNYIYSDVANTTNRLVVILLNIFKIL